MTLGVVALSIYVLGFPILTWALAFLYKRVIVRRAEEKILRKKLSKKPPQPVGPKWWKRFKFTLRDKRQLILGRGKKKEEKASGFGIRRNLLWWILWLGGLGLAAASFTGQWSFIFWSLLAYVVAFSYAVQSAHKVVKKQEYVVGKIYEIAQPKLGLPNQDPAESHVRIIEWRDYVKPDKVEIDVPTNFSSDGEESFMKQFNQVFGRETAWVPDNKLDEGKMGWDYEEGKVTIRAVPPLPMRAPWAAHYVDNPAIAWSFFPIALGVENGTTLTHPETGEREYVLGFDLSGKQADAAKAAGEVMSTKITVSPMVLVGGGTGGGKSLPVAEKVAVIRKKSTI